MVTREPRGHAFCFSDEKNGLSHGDKRALREPGAVDKHIQKTKFALFVTFKDSPMASSNLNDKKPELADDKEKKVTIGNYISLIMACVFFSGVCATNQWWGIFDFTTINGSFGRLSQLFPRTLTAFTPRWPTSAVKAVPVLSTASCLL